MFQKVVIIKRQWKGKQTQITFKRKMKLEFPKRKINKS